MTRHNTAFRRLEATAVILAGGAGRRVAGRDKGLIEWRGKALAQHVYERIAPQVTRVLISCNRNREHYARIATLSAGDRRDNYQGPLAGLEAAIPELKDKFTVLVPCDTPLLPDDLAPRLADALEASPDAQASYATTGNDRHYLCALLRQDCLASLEQFLDSGGRAVRHWYEEIGAVAVNFDSQADCFINLNRL